MLEGPSTPWARQWCDNPADLTRDNPGEVVLLRGRVLGSQGQPLPEASLDFWQNAANGLYWQMDSSQPQDNLRCQLKVDAAGRFAVRTIKPQPYQIPTDGPAWRRRRPGRAQRLAAGASPPHRSGAGPPHAGDRALRRRRPTRPAMPSSACGRRWCGATRPLPTPTCR
ncbi:MAG: hypothetical protein IPF94_13730 [Betaproteobacteria bacterium]|nr:hypothetical protein [Betaproteobacteria bacterium]